MLDTIFAPNGVLKTKNENYKQRPSQIEASKLILKALKEKNHFILGAGCGYGKSLAYLTSAILELITNEFTGKIIISTSSISLQEQLINKDIPFVIDCLSEATGVENLKNKLRPMTVKGRGNFICPSKVYSDDFMNMQTLIVDEEFKKVNSFINRTKTGDLTSANFIPSSDMRGLITCTDSSECKGTSCPERGNCYYQSHMNKAKTSKIIVTNYHMLFSSLKAGGNAFADGTIYIFDEAHEIDSIYREFNSDLLSYESFEYISKKLKEITNKYPAASDFLDSINVSKLHSSANKFFKELRELNNLKFTETYKLINSYDNIPSDIKVIEQLNSVIRSCSILAHVLENPNSASLNQEASQQTNLGNKEPDGKVKSHDLNDNPTTDTQSTLQQVQSLAKNLCNTCTSMINVLTSIEDNLSDENLAIWSEKDNEIAKLGLKSIDISKDFCEKFLDEPDVSCIFTSATISISNNFDYFKKRLGLNIISNENKKVYEFIGQTPFNLTNQELWYLPTDAKKGNDPNFEKIAPEQIDNLLQISNGGALCLFTSFKSMYNCKNYLMEKNKDYNILTQGELSKNKLINIFRNDHESTLLGTRSFFTGVDIQGPSLRVVIIDKLPFPTPNDPVQQKLQERENSFFNYSLPEMIITLKQAVGRGVRSVDDKCVICILDERISSAKYKKNIFNSFNYKKTSTRSLDVVKSFLEEY